MIAGSSIHTALHGIHEQATLQGSGTDLSREIVFRLERAFCFLFRNEFDSPEQADTPYITYRVQVLKGFQSTFEMEACRIGLIEICGVHQFLSDKAMQDGSTGGEGDWVSVIGEAVQESA